MKATVFLGGGRITRALVAGLRLAGDKRTILVHDRHPEKLRELKRRYAIIAEPNLQTAVASAGLLIIAVRPDSVSELLASIRSLQIKKVPIAVSLAAGIPLSILKAKLGEGVRWARAMPSPLCRRGRGLTALAFDQRLTSQDRRKIRDFFSRVGEIVEIPETQFDAFTVTFSSSHGYHAVAALIKAAEKLGLNRKTALTAAAHALADAIHTWRHGESSLTELLYEAATPGGTAAAVMVSMDQSGYEEMVEKGLRAGIKRALKNSTLIR